MDEVMTIKQMPADLKQFWAEEAKQQGHSIDKEVLRVLQEERARRVSVQFPEKDMARIMAAARRLQSFTVIDHRPVDDILYDEHGLPK